MPAIAQSHRIWGTRYDSLVDASPVKSSSPNNSNSDSTNIFHISNRDNSTRNMSRFQNTPSATSTARFSVHEDAAKERIHVQSGSQHHPQQQSSPASQISNTTPDAQRHYYPSYANSYSPSVGYSRMPHDASVFVASLPSHLSDSELQTLLTAHLSHHATIIHVKLIRDNRNAVCAFVQVQSATQATELIDKCNLTLFMDRQIRCEKARAFRTLLVSWVKEEESDTLRRSKSLSLQPLRLRRCRGSRFVQITSGADAMCGDPAQLANYSLARPDDPLSGAGVFFESGIIENDLESLKRLMEAFGPLEFIMPFDARIHQDGGAGDFELSATSAQDSVNASAVGVGEEFQPHSELSKTSQSACSEHEGVWAVKWEHRNDAVSAITALQSIPNLYVRWCHTHEKTVSITSSSASGLAGAQGNNYSSNPSTPYQPIHHHQTGVTNRQRAFEYGDGHQHKQYQYHSQTYPQSYSQKLDQDTIGPGGNKSVSLPLSFSESDFPPLNGNLSTEGSSSRSETSDIPNFSASTPSVGEYVDDRTPRRKDIRICGVWNGRKTFSRSNAPSPSPPPHAHSLPAPLPSSREEIQTRSVTGDFPNKMSDKLDFFGQELIPHTPDTPDLEPEAGGAEECASGIGMSPLTPGFPEAFPEAPHTPRSAYISRVTLGNEKLKRHSEVFGKINGLQDDLTRTDGNDPLNQASSQIYSHGRAHSTSASINLSSNKQYHQHQVFRDRRKSYDQAGTPEEYVSVSPNDSPVTSSSVDSMSDRELFVGGLKAESWSEERLKEVFGQYGFIEEVKFVKPAYNAPVHRRAFAFVRYVDSESAQKAIRDQHMCSYDGHSIKVQLRDVHPNSRRSQWNHRGRGRFNQGNGHSVHEHDRTEGINRGSSSDRLAALIKGRSPKEEKTPAGDVVSQYPCISDPLSQEEEAALRRDLGYDEIRRASGSTPPLSRSPGVIPSSSSVLTMPSFQSPEGPLRVGSVRRSTQSESDVQSPSSLHTADAVSTYAPSSIESAPASSNYHSHTHFVGNPWVPSYSMCAPVSQGYPQTGTTVLPPQPVATDGAFPWTGIYRNLMPAVPWFNPPPGVELTSAPLRPTGYIQRDGIFIPVYPPERLGHYMSTNSMGTGSNEHQVQPSDSTDRTASPPASTPTGGPRRTPPTQATTGTASWTTANATQPYHSQMYHMPYIVPPPTMMLSSHATHPGSQSQWMSNPSQAVIYPPSAHTPMYANSQQVQPHQQQPIAPIPMAVNGYPFYYQQPQVNSVNCPRGLYPTYYSDTNNTAAAATQVQKQAPMTINPSGGMHTQIQAQQNSGQNKYGNGNRRDFGNGSRMNNGNGRGPGRKGNSYGGGNDGSPNKSFGGPPTKMIVNALPIQVTASQ